MNDVLHLNTNPFLNRDQPRHSNSVINLMPLGYVADVNAWVSENHFFSDICYMRYVYVPIWEHWAGCVTFSKLMNVPPSPDHYLNAILKPLGVNGNPPLTSPKYVGATKLPIFCNSTTTRKSNMAAAKPEMHGKWLFNFVR
jgi:hypothetical protein